MPMPSLEELLGQMVKAQEIYASYGITTVQEGMVTKPLLEILKNLAERKLLYLDLVGYVDLEDSLGLLSENKSYVNNYQDHFKIGGYKIFLDGSPQGRTAWMKEPYEPAEEGYCGYPIKEDPRLEELIFEALGQGQQLLAHCNGDAAAEQYLTGFEKVTAKYPELSTCRPVMIHAQLVQREQLERMKPLSMIPGFFAAHTYYWGDIHIENFGMERARLISPAGTACRLGIPFTLHQDSPVLKPDVLESVRCAVMRVTRKGVELEKEERIPMIEALKAVTVYAAYQYGEEKEKGTIEEGKRADLVILDRNPLEISPEELDKVRILETIKDGKTVFQKKM